MKNKGLNLVVLLLSMAFFMVGNARAAQVDWPQELLLDGNRMLIHQPRVDVWTDYVTLEGRAPVSLESKTGGEPLVGVVWFTGESNAAMETRTVAVYNMQVTRVDFPSASLKTSRQAEDLVRAMFPAYPLEISLDFILDNLKDTRLVSSDPVRGLTGATEPPQIFVSKKPAILVRFDGEPILTPVEDADLMYVVNTSWDIFFQPKAGKYYLLNEDAWLAAPKIEGPWTAAGQLPGSLNRLPDEGNWGEVKKHIPGNKHGRAPVVFVSVKPAEMILLEGEPRLSPIKGTNILYAVNTKSDLFLHGGDGNYYYLVAGRWFKAAGLGALWAEVNPENLPRDFAAIPADHPKAHVLASVPGTLEAQQAIVQAQLPIRAEASRDAEPVTVSYAGEPEFVPVDGASVSYAVNTAYKVIEAGGRYYLCHQGVWFVSDAADGSYVVTEYVPEEIYAIPPGCPLYNVTYVKPYAATAAAVVFGYTLGYYGMYLAAGTVVYGTGYYYPPAAALGYYHPYPATYGSAAYYNPVTGVYAGGSACYGPYSGAGSAAYYNPVTGTYAQAAAAYGPYGGTLGASAYNPVAGVGAATHQSYNAYAQWGSSVVYHGDDWIASGHYSNSYGTAAGFATSTGAAGVVVKGENHSGGAVKTASGNMYVGVDGNVYKKTNDGWSQYENGTWNSVDPSAKVPADQAASAARQSQGDSAARQSQGDSAARQSQGDSAARQSQGDRPVRARATVPSDSATPVSVRVTTPFTRTRVTRRFGRDKGPGSQGVMRP